MEQALATFELTEKNMHDPLPWHELSREDISKLYKQADSRGKATLIAGQLRAQCNLYLDGWTLSLFRRVLLMFGVLDPKEVDPDFSADLPEQQSLPAEIAANYWTAPDPKLLFKRLPLEGVNSSAYHFSNNLGALVSGKWKQAFPESTVKELQNVIQGEIEGFIELLWDTFMDLHESAFYRTLREAYQTPRCTLRELLKVLERKFYQQNKFKGDMPEDVRKRYLRTKKRYFEQDMYERDASPERMGHE